MIRALCRMSVAALLLLASYTRGAAQVTSSGGEISYEFLYQSDGPTIYFYYRVTIKIFKECNEAGGFPFSLPLRIAREYPNNSFSPPTVQQADLLRTYTTSQIQNGCSSAPLLCYQAGVYETEVELQAYRGNYLLYIQAEARKKDKYRNVKTDGIGKRSGGVMGYTYLTRIPGMLSAGNVAAPSSPVVQREYPLILCVGQPFQYDFSAEDPDGDSLAYSFVTAYQGPIWTDPRFSDGSSSWPPFQPLIYYGSYSGAAPMGSGVQIDSKTGRISGTAPAAAGSYLVAVEITKFRNGVVMGRHRKETTFVFGLCPTPRAQLDSTYRNCNGTSVKFINYSAGPIQTYFWDFGVSGTDADTSNVREPVFNYPAPGTYHVKLYLNKGTNLCKDSAFATVIVDTGLRASFDARRSIDFCNKAVYDFNSTSTAGASPIVSYSWDFGEPSTSGDVSNLSNPSYEYPSMGTKLVRLIVRNENGCSDTMFRNILALTSLLQVQNDTTICSLDTITLRTSTSGYPGTFSWSPNYNISSLVSPAPRVSPKRDTVYVVSFTDTTGCSAVDSIAVTVRDSVQIQLSPLDTTICLFDTVSVRAVHDALSVSWQPAGAIVPVTPDGSLIQSSPSASTLLIATANLGSCRASDSLTVNVVPRPAVTVNNDTLVCFGAPVPLRASGGSIYSWTPTETLSNSFIANPLAYPARNTLYTVTVTDTLGCPKPGYGSVEVKTFRGLIAIAAQDTMVVEGEPVQLYGAGGKYFQWTPATYLSDPNSPVPVSRPFGDVTYVLRIRDDNNCTDSAVVKIRAFKDADLYVPTAFTPNSDGRNDVFRVFAVGIRLRGLSIFDRWGNLVYSTSDAGRGWDGRRHGVPAASGSFVWVVTGMNAKTGKPVQKKGTFTLVR